jgi:hypothetical protein
MDISIILDVAKKHIVRIEGIIDRINTIQASFHFQVSDKEISIGKQYDVLFSHKNGKTYLEKRKMIKSHSLPFDLGQKSIWRELIVTDENVGSSRKIHFIEWEYEKNNFPLLIESVHSEYVILITDKPFIDNWFSHTESNFSIISIYNVEEDLFPFRLDKYIMTEISQTVLSFYANMSESQLEKLSHMTQTTGCLFDFCENKMDLKTKIRLGYLCDDCKQILSNASVPTSVITTVTHMLDYVSDRKKFQKVFIVHGHDLGIRDSVARFVEKLGLEAIIISEQVNSSRTIIESIEKYSDVDFAIIIYSPCDVGGVKTVNTIEELKSRARQNVVFEHGYFIGRLGREYTLALYDGKLEIPSDINGVLYTVYDSAGCWKNDLLRALKNAGYNIGND